MLIDNEAKLTSATAFDLKTVRPGPGMALRMAATGFDADDAIAITHCDTAAGTYTECITIVADATGCASFTLPSTTLRYLKATFTGGQIFFILEGGAQTNV